MDKYEIHSTPIFDINFNFTVWWRQIDSAKRYCTSKTIKKRGAEMKTKKWDTAEHLRNKSEIDAYLESSFADGDIKQIIRALDNAVRALGMMAVARKIGCDRAGLYRTLSGDTDPRFSTILRVAEACGGRISYVPQKKSSRKSKE